MSLPKLLAILVAIAVLFAPAFSSAGMASAAALEQDAQAMPAGHHAQALEEGHCDSSDRQDPDEPGSMACCAATCMAVAVAPASVTTAGPLPGQVPVASLRAFRAGVPAELATPPPRAA